MATYIASTTMPCLLQTGDTEHVPLPLHAVLCHGVVHVLVYIGSILGSSVHFSLYICTLLDIAACYLVMQKPGLEC